jgi:hypothetical protein
MLRRQSAVWHSLFATRALIASNGQVDCLLDRRVQCAVYAGEGVITYMRTDGVQLAQEIVDGARAFVSQQYGPEYLPEQPRVYKCVGSNNILRLLYGMLPKRGHASRSNLAPSTSPRSCASTLRMCDST